MQKRHWSPLPFHPTLPSPRQSKAKNGRSDDDCDDDEGGEHDEHLVRATIDIFDRPSRPPRYTGVLTEMEEPIYRFYMPQPGIGFTDPDVGSYEPDAYAYGLHPTVFVDSVEGEEEADEEPLDEDE